MYDQSIEIHGITPLTDYPGWIQVPASKQFYETDRLCISCQNPTIECILEIFINLSISSYKIICTPAGKKLLIQGIKNIKIIYVADDSCQSVHTARFEVPFCTFVLIGCGQYNVCSIFAAAEDVRVLSADRECFLISILIFVSPELQEIFPVQGSCPASYDSTEDCAFVSPNTPPPNIYYESAQNNTPEPECGCQNQNPAPECGFRNEAEMPAHGFINQNSAPECGFQNETEAPKPECGFQNETEAPKLSIWEEPEKPVFKKPFCCIYWRF